MQVCRKIVIALAAAALCAGPGAGVAVAKRLDQVDGPAELPPPGYAGRQYIDSQGCAFVRAGVGSRTVWIPRVSRDGEVLCGLAPSIARAATPEPAPRPATAPAAGRAAGTGKAVARQTGAAARPAAKRAGPIRISTARARQICKGAAPGDLRLVPGTAARLRCEAAYVGAAAQATAPARTAATATSPDGQMRAKTATRPVPAGLRLRDADISRLCTAYRAGTRLRVRQGERSTIIRCPTSARRVAAAAPAQGSPRAAAKPAPVALVASPRIAARATGPVRLPAMTPMKPPRGYRLAWTDGRLNPRRAIGTAEGEAAMLRVWTATVPRHLRTVAGAAQTPVRKSSMASAGVLIQLGLFSRAENARAAARKVGGLGYPVLRARARSGRLAVLAGPFTTRAAARDALSRLRKAGFADAFLR